MEIHSHNNKKGGRGLGLRAVNVAKEEAGNNGALNRTKMSAMSGTESYFPDAYNKRVSKFSIFGDPWNASKNRNKRLIEELLKGNV